MSDPTRPNSMPRGVLLAAAALVGFAILSAMGARVSGIGTTELPAAAPVEGRELRFEDRVDGGVAVFEDGRIVHVVAPGTNGFLRGVLRGLARERKLRGVRAELPFRLTRWADGRLSVEDPATGRSVDLGAFGPANWAAFAQILTTPEATP
jgi:putative photosynthetic complex assembly protein